MTDIPGAASRTGVRALLEGTVLEIAPRLLGAILWTDFDGLTSVKINEVEAYAGADDPASHAYRGPTARNGSMFGPAGTVYVYRSYGIHWCMNIVVGEPGLPHAILIRAGDPIAGLALMQQRRARTDHVADGPGKLCQALGVTGAVDGSSLYGGPISLEPAPTRPDYLATPRVGISKARERPWRFVAVGGGAPRLD